jgi:chain length determinant protein (polysaccharide antigen chain regulator)
VTGKNEVMIEKAAYANDDEIDLFDLIDDIWSHKRWVFLGLFVTVLLAGLYLFQATPVYQTEAKVKSATANDLIEFTRPQLSAIYTLNVDGAFSYAKAALLSTNYRKEFYELKLGDIKAVPDAYNEELTLGQNFSRFSENFSIKTSGAKDSETYVQLSLKSADAEFASELLNEFIEYALFRRLRDTYNTMLARIDGRIETLDYQAEVKREAYFSDKARRILKLKEATAIAIAVGQIDPVYRNMDLVGGQKPPLYMLGSKAIKAEIKALESREKMAKGLPRGEDHFIKGLPEILLEIDSLKTLEVDFSKIQLARIDEVATIPVKPIKPRKLLVVALALVAGLFIGLFMALIVAAYGKRKARTEEKR